MIPSDLTPQLLALRSLRGQARMDMGEALCIENWNSGVVDGEGTLLSDLTETGLDKAFQHFVRLLADFTRWQSQAWALRRIAELLGWKIGDHVPALTHVDTDFGSYWVIQAKDQEVAVVERPSCIPGIQVLVVPGIGIDFSLPVDQARAIVEQSPEDPSRRSRVIAAVLLHLEAGR